MPGAEAFVLFVASAPGVEGGSAAVGLAVVPRVPASAGRRRPQIQRGRGFANSAGAR